MTEVYDNTIKKYKEKYKGLMRKTGKGIVV